MDEQQAFLNAIHAHPDDDLVRLVCADWLDEHGQPDRAEFIRAQIELARCATRLENARGEVGVREVRSECAAFESRQEELLAANEEAWLAAFGDWNRNEFRIGFARGFPETMTAATEEPEGYGVLRLFPGLRRIFIEGGRLSPGAIREIASLTQLDRLHIEGADFEADWFDLLDSLPPWTSVRIWGRPSGLETEWRAFLDRRLAGLMLAPPDRVRRAAIQLLADCNFGVADPSRSVSTARLSQVGASDFDLALLSYLSELEEVNIFQGEETEAGLRFLARLPNLRSVDLGRGLYPEVWSAPNESRD